MSKDINQFDAIAPLNAERSSSHLLEGTALSICHELRTPLTAIQGALGLLQTGQLGFLSDEGMRLLAIALNNVSRLTRLADAIENEPLSSMLVLSDDTIEQFHLGNELHEAIDLEQLHLVYQPIVSVENHQVVGFEALARWKHPFKGNISPDLFIPLAEKTGCIHQLGLWVLEQACHRLYAWQQQFPRPVPISMSVNLSALQLLQPNLIQEIQQILEKTMISPDTLKLEITESALIENQQAAITLLSELRAMGIQLYVDDFGTGYSSLGRLQELPIDTLKIDRSFVQGKQWDISETIVLLAAKLGLSVIAEGVETAEDLAALQSLGCTQMQGYHFSKPLEGHAVTAFMLILSSHELTDPSSAVYASHCEV
ncbi:MAG: EAL domain-containing protein [Leptolyngbya sp. BL-A-14]